MSLIDELEREKSYSDSMKAAAQMWMARAQEAERQIMALVHAAGGEIRIAPETPYELPSLELEKSRDEANRLLIFRTRQPQNKPRPLKFQRIPG